MKGVLTAIGRTLLVLLISLTLGLFLVPASAFDLRPKLGVF